MTKTPTSFRDVSLGLQKLRDFLLGRKNVYHNRFPPALAPRSIPPPDIPRGPDDRYSNQRYFQRSPYARVKPPVVAPIAADFSAEGVQQIKFNFPPTPGQAWWWDSHCYYEKLAEIAPPPPPSSACPPPPPATPPPPSSTPPPPPPCSPPPSSHRCEERSQAKPCDPCVKP